jgi:hypothetical protein
MSSWPVTILREAVMPRACSARELLLQRLVT